MAHIMKKKRHKSGLFGYYACLLHDLLLIPLEAYTHRDIHICMHMHTHIFADEMISRTRRTWATLHVPGLKMASTLFLNLTCT